MSNYLSKNYLSHHYFTRYTYTDMVFHGVGIKASAQMIMLACKGNDL